MRRIRIVLFSLTLLGSATVAVAVTITVDTLADESPVVANGNCSFREALAAANSNAAVDACPAGSSATTDEIEFSVIGTITVVADLPMISESLSIIGPGSDLLTISGESSFLPTYQLFQLLGNASSPRPYLLKGLTLRGGLADSVGNDGGCIAISNVAQVTLDHVFITGCQSQGAGGAIHQSGGSGGSVKSSLDILWSDVVFNEAMGARGGGINLAGEGDLNLENSSVSANTVHGTVGGGVAIGRPIAGSGTSVITVQRSTIANNTNFGAFGGGLYVRSLSAIDLIDVAVRHSTITGNIVNAASSDEEFGEGAGIHADGEGLSLNLTNSIVAKNLDIGGNPTPTVSDDLEVPTSVAPPTVTTGGFNFIGTVADVSGATPFSQGLPNGDDDFVGTTPAGLSPGLSALGDYGGFSRSAPPSGASSPVLDKGRCAGEKLDQRGFGKSVLTRAVDLAGIANTPGGDGCDIGAVELNGLPVSDYDGDGTVDENDDFPLDPNETTDTDGDGIGDNADPDDDNDGMPDTFEDMHPGLSRFDPSDAGLDPDNDQLTNLEEFDKDPGLDPNDPDTDDDEIQDNFDDLPVLASNVCTGTDATFNVAVSAAEQCAAKSSVTLQGTASVTATGAFEILAPLIAIESGFSVDQTGTMLCNSIDPCPACP